MEQPAMQLNSLLTRSTAVIALLVGATSAHADALQGEAVVSQLQAGGFVVYMRHAPSDLEQSDADPVVIGDCSTQRNLSDDGRAVSEALHDAYQALEISFAPALSSPYCRAMDTAMLAFGDAEASDTLFYSLGLSSDGAATAAEELKVLLGTVPTAGQNAILVGHTSNLKEVAGVWPENEGDAFVFQPNGDGSFTVVGSYSATDVIELAARSGS